MAEKNAAFPVDPLEKALHGLEFPLELTAYHGTDAEFERFDLSKAGNRDPGFFGSGIYLTPDLEDAQSYAESAMEDAGKKGEGRVITALISLRNPFVWDVSCPQAAEETRLRLKTMGIHKLEMTQSMNLSDRREREKFDRFVRQSGHDGVLVLHDEDVGTDQIKPKVVEIVAFHPDQIKISPQSHDCLDNSEEKLACAHRALDFLSHSEASVILKI